MKQTNSLEIEKANHFQRRSQNLAKHLNGMSCENS